MGPLAIVGSGSVDNALGHTFSRAAGFPYWTLGITHRGAVRIRSRGAEGIFNEGDIGLTRPNTPYDIEFSGSGKRWSETWIIFADRPEWTDLLSWPELIPGMMRLSGLTDHGRQAIRAFVEADRWGSSAATERKRLAANALELGLLLMRMDVPGHRFRSEGVRVAYDLLAAAPSEPMTMQRLARRARMSPSHLAHQFTREVGEPPMRFLEGRRIDRAKSLLVGTNLSIKAIASACGFDNPFHFSTRFRARVGRSPRALRLDPMPQPPDSPSQR